MKPLLAVLVLVAALLTGCGDILDHGRVTGKDYYPAHTDVIWYPIQTGSICSSYSTGAVSCTPVYTSIPYDSYVPEAWVLKLKADCTTKEDGTEKCKHGRAYVDPVTWRETKVGAYWEKHPGTSKPNPPVRLKRSNTGG